MKTKTGTERERGGERIGTGRDEETEVTGMEGGSETARGII